MPLRRGCLVLAFVALLVSFLPEAARAQTLDQYGGYLNLPAPGGATGSFRVEKIGARWVFVTPSGNALWMAGVFTIDGSGSVPDQGINYDQVVSTKYPQDQYGNYKPAWANQALKRISSWGFNTVAEYASGYVYPFGRPAGALLMPMANGMRPSWYGLMNSGGYAPGPFKALEDCVDTAVYTGWISDGPPDVFDPNFDAYVNGQLKATAADPFWSGLLTSPWMIGMAVDDADQLQGFGPGLEILAPDGVITVHIGWLALAVSPTKNSSSKYGVTYTDSTVFTKKALHDFLVSKYGTIDVLNAAWGSTYTTFDSAGGWKTGTGLMDENGRHTAWLGNSDGTLRNAAPAVVADLDAFLYQYAVQYFSVTSARFRQYAPNRLVFGPSVLNGHGGLTRGPVLRAAGQYLDVIQASVTSQQMLDLTVQYVGDKPIVTWEGYPANSDSALWRYGNPGFGSPTQGDRGTWYANRINFLLNTKTSTAGVFSIAGFKLWAWSDSWGEKTNWGLVSFRDNAYNGKEAVIAPGSDPWGYSTGGEEHNYGDFIGSVVTANQRIFSTITAGVSLPSVPPPLPPSPLTVSLTSPTAGATVQGTVLVTAAASAAATRIDLLLDGSIIGSFSGTAASYSWNSTTVGNGSHQWLAQVYDASSTRVDSSPVTVVVSNVVLLPPPPPATPAPPAPALTVVLTSPTAGSVQGVVTVTATASAAAVRIELLFDGIRLGSFTGTSASMMWNTAM